MQYVSMCVCVFVTVYRVVWQPVPHDRSGHSGQWHSSRAPDASWASGVKNAGRPDPLSRRWMERSVHSPIDEWSDLSCQRRSTERLQYPAYTCVFVYVGACVCVRVFADCGNWLKYATHTQSKKPRQTRMITMKYARLQYNPKHLYLTIV